MLGLAMLLGPVRYILAPRRLQSPIITALPGCRATALPPKRDVTPTPVVAKLMAATSVRTRPLVAPNLKLDIICSKRTK
jgi:hypothetical protein